MGEYKKTSFLDTNPKELLPYEQCHQDIIPYGFTGAILSKLFFSFLTTGQFGLNTRRWYLKRVQVEHPLGLGAALGIAAWVVHCQIKLRAASSAK